MIRCLATDHYGIISTLVHSCTLPHALSSCCLEALGTCGHACISLLSHLVVRWFYDVLSVQGESFAHFLSLRVAQSGKAQLEKMAAAPEGAAALVQVLNRVMKYAVGLGLGATVLQTTLYNGEQPTALQPRQF